MSQWAEGGKRGVIRVGTPPDAPPVLQPPLERGLLPVDVARDIGRPVNLDECAEDCEAEKPPAFLGMAEPEPQHPGSKDQPRHQVHAVNEDSAEIRSRARAVEVDLVEFVNAGLVDEVRYVLSQ